MEMVSGGGCTALRIYLMPLSCTFKSGLNGQFYVIIVCHNKNFFFLKEETSALGSALRNGNGGAAKEKVLENEPT